MVFSAFRWRTGALLGALALLLPLGMACHGSSGGGSTDTTVATITLKGTVNYQRPPLLSDANGLPLGLESDTSKFAMVPARGVFVQAYQEKDEKDLAGNTQRVWTVAANAYTDSTGAYTMDLPVDRPVIVELLSLARFLDSDGAPQAVVRLFAEDVEDHVLAGERRYYSIRKRLDGVSADMGSATLPPIPTTDTTLDFNVNLGDSWLRSPSRSTWTPADFVDRVSTLDVNGTTYTHHFPNLEDETSLPIDKKTGSRVLAILDSFYEFAASHGSPNPAFYLDLHYKRGVSNSLGTYVDYDKATYDVRRPECYYAASESYVHVGTIRGGVSGGGGVDDSFNQGVLYTLAGRNVLAGYSVDVPMPLALPGTSAYLEDRQDLRPDLAIQAGLPEAMAAALIKSPYIPETTGVPGGGLNPAHPYRDIRNTTGLKVDPFSGPNLTAFAWEIVLKANSLASPGVPADWAKIDPKATARFFKPVFIGATNSSTTITGDVINIYGQLQGLQTSKSSSEPVDLQAIFTDAVLTSMATPFNIPWPRPTTGSAPNSPYLSFYSFWGTDPNSTSGSLPTVRLSMDYARKTPYGTYSNYSFGVDDPLIPTSAKGESYPAVMCFTRDTTYNISLMTIPAIPAGAIVRVSFGSPSTNGALSYSAVISHDFGPSSNMAPIWNVTPVRGSAATTSSLQYVPVNIRLISPNTKQPSDILVSLTMIPAN